MTCKHDLTKKIENLREKMNELGIKTSLTSPEVVKVSQELEKLLLFLYMKRSNLIVL